MGEHFPAKCLRGSPQKMRQIKNRGALAESEMTAVPTTKLPSGDSVPVLGLGAWMMGESARHRKDEVAALRLGVDLGMNLIDTAEMYANGGSERVVAEAIAGRRDKVFLVSKVLPQNATRKGTIAACEQSLKRLNTDRLDLYLLHWRQSIPLHETLEGLTTLKRDGNIRNWGVSNFDVDDMEELLALEGGDKVATNQVMYNLRRRGIEFELLPWSRKRHIPIMAYSPLDQGHLMRSSELMHIAERNGATPAQIALAWTIRQPGVFSIPKASRESHVRDNFKALGIRLKDDDLAELDRYFRPPAKKKPLEMT
jgi:diketogulonate reductase-like aldo/keto reductase